MENHGSPLTHLSLSLSGCFGCVFAFLQGWGCRKITFVDSGKVAFSNPVRQSLFEFADCLEGGRPKAEAAAAALQRIFPEADAQGVQLTIPMPGHPVKEGSPQHKHTSETVQKLDALVQVSNTLVTTLSISPPPLLFAFRGRR